jgi:hypothetical protein
MGKNLTEGAAPLVGDLTEGWGRTYGGSCFLRVVYSKSGWEEVVESTVFRIR